MILEFTKMHGLGNNFVVIDGVSNEFNLSPEQIRTLGNRHTGVGFDQLLVIAPATAPGFDFSYLVFNPDGLQVENCGNGARCMVSFIRNRGLSDNSEFTLQLINGSLHCQAEADGNVTVDMGAPRFEPQSIPFKMDTLAVTYPLILPGGELLEVGVLSMGNPHAVLIVPDIDQAPVSQWGPLIENHENFPDRVNAGFMQVINTGTIRLRVFERGAGETLACGTGACAAVVSGIQQGLLDNSVTVQLPCGDLQINWQGENTSVFKSGPAETVFEGNIEL
ncbi:MAG: diaminopimelate epimerase [Pseudomonadales bacterium]|jgi:diaminopimelate epimerase